VPACSPCHAGPCWWWPTALVGAAGARPRPRAVVGAVASALTLSDASSWAGLLSRVDQALPSGETTAVVLRVDGEQLFGASVGDSVALLVDGGTDRCMDLTAAQHRKPLVGSRRASPVAFSSSLGHSTLLMASDGLLKYARQETIVEVVKGADFGTGTQDRAGVFPLSHGPTLAGAVARPRPRRSSAPWRRRSTLTLPDASSLEARLHAGARPDAGTKPCGPGAATEAPSLASRPVSAGFPNLPRFLGQIGLHRAQAGMAQPSQNTESGQETRGPRFRGVLRGS
jgi:hypothetical protein